MEGAEQWPVPASTVLRSESATATQHLGLPSVLLLVLVLMLTTTLGSQLVASLA